MGDHAEEEKKSPFDDIINDMTSEWQSYGVAHTSSPAQAPNPASTPGPVPGPTPGTTPASQVWTSWSGRQPQPQPFYVIGGGEPNPPVYFQSDHPPPPGFEVDANAAAHAVKQNEFFKQHMGPVTPREGTDVIGTVVDIGGGNYVNVVYSGGPGGTVHPQYLSVNPTATAVSSVLGSNVLDAPTLENILSYPGSAEQGIQQQANVPRNYGLFREVQPQQIQALLQQQQQLQQLQQQQLQQQQLQQHHLQQQQLQQHHLQQQLEQLQQNQSSQQSQPSQVQHHQQHAKVQTECQPNQMLNCQPKQQLSQIQQQHSLSEQSVQQQQHEEGSLHQLQHLPSHSSQSAEQRKSQHSQPLSTPLQKEQELSKLTSDPVDYVPVFSPNQDLLIQNLVGNWTVPNQTGRYNPFGLGLGQGSEPVQDGVKEPEINKRSDKCVRRTRIVAEVRPMRPSYSAVLTTPSPVPSPQKPNQTCNIISNNNNNNSVNNNPNTNAPNSANRINAEAPRQKSTAIVNGGKTKTSVITPKTNGSVSAGGKLKRQHSSGSDEPSTTPVKSSGVTANRKPTGISTSSSVGLEEVLPSGIGTTLLSRCWVSLDDLDNDGEKSNIYEELDQRETRDKDSVSSCKRDVDSASVRGVLRGASKHPSQHDEAFLNNYKTPNCHVGSKGMTSSGSNSNKRPIHINNNLGTTLSTQWGGQQSAGAMTSSSNGTSTVNSSSNTFTSKGDKGATKGGKSCRTCSDERKGSKNDSKSANNGNGSGSSSRSGRGSASMADKVSVLQGKRNQRGSRRKDGLSAAALVIRRYGKLALLAVTWFLHLLSDVVGMSLRLSIHLCAVVWENWILSTFRWLKGSVQRIPRSVPNRIKQSSVWCWLCRRFGWSDPGTGSSRKGGRTEGRETNIPGGLSQNISMPSTGEEAMKRLLACKGKDPYSILGVTPSCSDDDVKKYYKRQAFLVHPDKNSQPGAEEAFKILVHAFDLIGEPEKRAEYDRCVAETQQVEQAWSELSDLLSQLHQKMEYAANTIRCTNCGKRHKRVAVPRKPFAARFCAQCKIKHSAKEGDIWAETMVMGFLWHYYACMEGAVYDITDWASCQTNNLRHLKPNSHTVQYRIVLGRQRQQHSRSPSEPDLENFLSSLYNQTGVLRKNSPGTGEGAGTTSAPQRQEQTRNRKKGKRNK